MESKYESLIDENKKLLLMSERKLPLKIPENLYIEKQVIEDRLKRTEKKLQDAQEKLKLSATHIYNPLFDPQNEIIDVSNKDLEKMVQAEQEKNVGIKQQLKEERGKLKNEPKSELLSY